LADWCGHCSEALVEAHCARFDESHCCIILSSKEDPEEEGG